MFGNNKKPELDETEDKKPLLEHNKSPMERVIHFFTYTIKYAILNPWMRTVKDFFGMGPKHDPKSQAWYEWIWSSKQEDKKWYQKYNFVKSAKDKVVSKFMMLFGGLFFIYVLAKAIPASFRNKKVKAQELEIEQRKLELEKMKLELEKMKLEWEMSHK